MFSKLSGSIEIVTNFRVFTGKTCFSTEIHLVTSVFKTAPKRFYLNFDTHEKE